MLLSKAKKPEESSPRKKAEDREKDLSDVDKFVRTRDFAGAITALEFQKNNLKQKGSEKSGEAAEDPIQLELWTAYCNFHAGNYQAALTSLKTVLKERESKGKELTQETRTWMACCHFYLGAYEEAAKEVKAAKPDDSLANRIKFHLAFKKGDEKLLVSLHKTLSSSIEDQLTLAAMHYLRGHFSKALESYKQIYASAVGNQKLRALEIYIAMCLFKMEEFESALDYAVLYLRDFPDSVIGNNLKASIDSRLLSKEAGLESLVEFKGIIPDQLGFGRELLRHNEAVFSEGLGGSSTLQVLQPLVGVVPEARINLAIYHLKCSEFGDAASCLKAGGKEPTTSQEYILRACLDAIAGQERGDLDSVDAAKEGFKIVGESPSHCDTIPGRQCMAAQFMLHKNYEEAIVFLKSIKPFNLLDDTFNMNYAQCLAAVKDWVEMDEALESIASPGLRQSFIFKCLALKCHVMNKRPHKAWAIYESQEPDESALIMLQMLSTECYRTGQFLMSLRGHAHLLSLSDDGVVSNYRGGLRGSIVGAFQQILAGEEPNNTIVELLEFIGLYEEGDARLSHVGSVMRAWAKDNNVVFR